MKLLGTLTTILVLGVWTATIAYAETSDENELTVDFDDFNDTQVSEDSILSGIGDAEIGNLTREDCEKNGGGPTAYSAAKLGWESFLNSSKSGINATEFQFDSLAALFTDEWSPFFAKYCGKLPALFQHTSIMMDAVKPCLDSERRQTIENHYNISTSFLQYVCENDGNLMASLFAADGLECISSKQRELDQSCPVNVAHVRNAPDSNLLWIKLDSLDCTNVDKYISCIVGVMRTCENPRAAERIVPIFNFFKQRKSCPSIPPKQISPAA